MNVFDSRKQGRPFDYPFIAFGSTVESEGVRGLSLRWAGGFRKMGVGACFRYGGRHGTRLERFDCAPNACVRNWEYCPASIYVKYVSLGS